MSKKKIESPSEATEETLTKDYAEHRDAKRRTKKRERTARWLAGEWDSKPKSNKQPTYVSVATQTDEPSPPAPTERKAGQSEEPVELDEVVQQKIGLPVRLRDGDANESLVGLDEDDGGDGDGREGDARSLSNLEHRKTPTRS